MPLNRFSAWLADRSLLTKGICVVLIPLTPLVVISLLIFAVQAFQRDAAAAVARSQDVDTELYELLALLGEAEAGQRAYLLTGDESWRTAQAAARQRTEAVFARLDGIIVDPQQRTRLSRMPDLIARRLDRLDEVAVESRTRVHPLAGPGLNLEPGRALMTAVRAETAAMMQRQRQLLAERTARADRMGRLLLLVTGGGTVLGVLGSIVAVMLFASGIASRVKVLTDSASRLAHGLPPPTPPPGADEIGVLGRQLTQAAGLLADREHAIQRAHYTLDQFFSLSLDLFCVAGFDGYFKRLNPAWIETLGWRKTELLAQPFLDFVHADDRDATARQAANLGHGDRTASFENRYRCKDGTYRWLQWMAIPVVEEGRIYAVARDITSAKETAERALALTAELRQKNAQLASLNHELEAFSYSVSHDLRAPLRSIDGFSQVLLEDCAEQLNEEGRDALERVRRAANTMGELIDALLALSRVTRAELRIEQVDLSALSAAIASELRSAEPDRRVEVEIAPGMLIDADPRLLRSMLVNLLGNAWKYTRPRDAARIEVGSYHEQGDTVYFVRDNGVGFDMAYRDKLFGAFQRLHRQSEFAGTGVGLATVHRIIRRHGGRTWAEGAIDQGATFYFTLPRPTGRDPVVAHSSAVVGNERRL